MSETIPTTRPSRLTEFSARIKGFFVSSPNFIPVKGDPDGPVEGVDVHRVASALHRFGSSSHARESWDTYQEWKPKFSGPPNEHSD